MSVLYLISETERTYKHGIFINGRISWGIELPYVECGRCGESQSSDRRLPFECPRLIRNEIESMDLRKSFNVIPRQEFERLAKRWEAILRDCGHDVQLKPGDEFLPRRWKMPSIPRYDFYWQLYYNAVSERIVRLFESNRVTGVTFYPLFAKVGMVEPTDFSKVPQEGDPDFFLDDFPSTDNPGQFGRFYEMHVDNWSPPCPRRDEVTITECSVCGGKDFDESDAYKNRKSHLREMKMLPKRHAFDVDIFHSDIFSGFVISAKARALLSDEHLRNCVLTRLTVVDD